MPYAAAFATCGYQFDPRLEARVLFPSDNRALLRETETRPKPAEEYIWKFRIPDL
jgi:hypothetical protein